jgi:hypothetical protein
VCACVCLPLCMFACLFVCCINLSIWLPACVPLCLFVSLYVSLFVCRFSYLSTCVRLSVCLDLYPCVSLTVCVIICLFVSLCPRVPSHKKSYLFLHNILVISNHLSNHFCENHLCLIFLKEYGQNVIKNILNRWHSTFLESLLTTFLSSSLEAVPSLAESWCQCNQTFYSLLWKRPSKLACLYLSSL